MKALTFLLSVLSLLPASSEASISDLVDSPPGRRYGVKVIDRRTDESIELVCVDQEVEIARCEKFELRQNYGRSFVLFTKQTIDLSYILDVQLVRKRSVDRIDWEKVGAIFNFNDEDRLRRSENRISSRAYNRLVDHLRLVLRYAQNIQAERAKAEVEFSRARFFDEKTAKIDIGQFRSWWVAHSVRCYAIEERTYWVEQLPIPAGYIGPTSKTHVYDWTTFYDRQTQKAVQKFDRLDPSQFRTAARDLFVSELCDLKF